MTSRSALATAVLLSALVAGCGSGQTPAQVQASEDEIAAAIATEAPTLDAAAVPDDQAISVCTDPEGDATTNDLNTVALRRDGDNLLVKWSVAEVDTGVGTAGFYVNVASEDGSAAGQIGVKFLDGRQISYFTFDNSMNKEITGEAEVTATSISASFPMIEFQRYGPNFKWGAATTRDGSDVDACPDVDQMRFND